MTLITKIPGVVFTDPTLPKLYRDSIITPGTKFCFDSKDLYSYPKQAAPIPGTDTWVDLSPNASPANFTGAAPTFTNGGFTYDPSGASRAILLPVTGKSPASAEGFLAGWWIKHLAPSPNAYAAIAGMADSTLPSLHQYSLDMGNANTGMYRLMAMGSIGLSIAPEVNSVHQFVCAAKKQPNGTYEKYFWHNGVLVGTLNTGNISIGQPTAQYPRIGAIPGFQSSGSFTAFRAFFDDTSALASVADMTALVLKDYNDNVGRIS